MAAAIPPIVVSAHPAKDDETSPNVVVEGLPEPEGLPAPAATAPPAAVVATGRAHMGQ